MTQHPDDVAAMDSMKVPHEKKHTCKNHMLEAINAMPHLTVNGEKDSRYNDLILFEDYFEHWDQKAILLTHWDWERTYKEPYVYIAPLGIYTEIGVFARKLQRLLGCYKEIHVMLIGDDLHITCYVSPSDSTRSTSFQAKRLHINQIEDGFHREGWKFDLPRDEPQEV